MGLTIQPVLTVCCELKGGCVHEGKAQGPESRGLSSGYGAEVAGAVNRLAASESLKEGLMRPELCF